MKNLGKNDVICALSSPPGMGAIAIIRVSGVGSLTFLDQLFQPASHSMALELAGGYTIQHGHIRDGEEILDEVLVNVFRMPHSYTGEDLAEINCHGSLYIQKRIIELLLHHGARLADPGEFTLRAFHNGKFDLTRAEAVADLIASNTKSAHDLAIRQMRGGFAKKIDMLRKQMVDFAALMELELDFSEEDVEFADRTKFLSLLGEIRMEIRSLIRSFQLGNVLKTGIPVAIIGKPNVGKSTLLNAILNEEKAIVSEIPGTTRDYIEDIVVIKGVAFRFIDTAGLRHTSDEIETMGIERTYEKIKEARVILYVFDVNQTPIEELKEVMDDLSANTENNDVVIMPLANKTDMLVESPHHFRDFVELNTLFISAKRKENINLILDRLSDSFQLEQAFDSTIISNLRHYEALDKALVSLDALEQGLNSALPTDLVAIDLRQVLHHLGTITGEISSDEVLGAVFGRFCIGK